MKFTLRGKTVYLDGVPTKKLTSLPPEVVGYWEVPTFFAGAPGEFYFYVFMDFETRQKLYSGKLSAPIMMPPYNRKVFGMHPLEDVWKNRHEEYRKLVGIVRGQQREDECFLDMMTVRPKFRHNNINTLMLQTLADNFAKGKPFTADEVTRDGQAFFERFDPEVLKSVKRFPR